MMTHVNCISLIAEMKAPVSSSLIISTYNRKDALELTLKSALEQKLLPDEIIVADDGSRSDTRDLVNQYKEISPIPLIHVWHEDSGFQLAKIRNRAVARSKGEYIVSIDGDLILHRSFIQDHLEVARKGVFLQGHRALLSEKLTQSLIAKKHIHFSLWNSIFSRGVDNKKNTLHSTFLRDLLAHSHENLRGIRGCNMSFWKEDLKKVNGFNESFVGWGREDSELALRFFHSGIKRVDLRFSGIIFHLFHPENSRDSLSTNDSELEKTKIEKRKWCEMGLNQYEA